ncbi:hypothetical protein YFHUAIHA_CDS0050 [Phage C48C1]|nr:hypothetical protein YFHUAIHA_CDS0050 [Phage C48C1]
MNYQANLTREYAHLRRKAGNNPTPKQKKRIEKLEKLLRRTL